MEIGIGTTQENIYKQGNTMHPGIKQAAFACVANDPIVIAARAITGLWISPSEDLRQKEVQQSIGKILLA